MASERKKNRNPLGLARLHRAVDSYLRQRGVAHPVERMFLDRGRWQITINGSNHELSTVLQALPTGDQPA